MVSLTHELHASIIGCQMYTFGYIYTPVPMVTRNILVSQSPHHVYAAWDEDEPTAISSGDYSAAKREPRKWEEDFSIINIAFLVATKNNREYRSKVGEKGGGFRCRLWIRMQSIFGGGYNGTRDFVGKCSIAKKKVTKTKKVFYKNKWIILSSLGKQCEFFVFFFWLAYATNLADFISCFNLCKEPRPPTLILAAGSASEKKARRERESFNERDWMGKKQNNKESARERQG